MYREGDKLYLVMGLMRGRQLGLLWDDLSEDEKLYILKQLRSIWDYMRSLPSPTLFSSVSGGPLRHRFFLCTILYKANDWVGRNEGEACSAKLRPLALLARIGWGEGGQSSRREMWYWLREPLFWVHDLVSASGGQLA